MPFGIAIRVIYIFFRKTVLLKRNHDTLIAIPNRLEGGVSHLKLKFHDICMYIDLKGIQLALIRARCYGIVPRRAAIHRKVYSPPWTFI